MRGRRARTKGNAMDTTMNRRGFIAGAAALAAMGGMAGIAVADEAAEDTAVDSDAAFETTID